MTLPDPRTLGEVLDGGWLPLAVSGGVVVVWNSSATYNVHLVRGDGRLQQVDGFTNYDAIAGDVLTASKIARAWLTDHGADRDGPRTSASDGGDDA